MSTDERIYDSDVNIEQAVQRCHNLGEPSRGDGWRRLLFRVSKLLEAGAPPSPSLASIEQEARGYLLGPHGGLWKEQVDGVVRTANGQSSILKLCAAFHLHTASKSPAPVSQRGLTDEEIACVLYPIKSHRASRATATVVIKKLRDNGYISHPSQELIRAGDAMYDAMRRYEMDVDEDPPMKHREMMDAWDAAKQSSPSQPLNTMTE